jgi:ABC-type nitrate/sulfonate/bicarbonate transport system substrate-binding protein
VRVFEGEVVQPEPNFRADNPDAMVAFHNALNDAVRDAEAERDRSIEEGWQLYHAEWPPF